MKKQIIQKLLGDIATTCIDASITFRLENSEQVSGSSGYFLVNRDQRELVVACKKPESVWLPTLIHESCHMDQYLEAAQVWEDLTLADGEDACETFFNWIDGYSYSRELVERCASVLLKLELDCEKRTLDKIINYGLSKFIDPVVYTQKANSYAYFYLYMLESRKFYSCGNEPYVNPLIWSVAPDHFENDYTAIPPDLYKAFKRHI